jgi:hypothetical protein
MDVPSNTALVGSETLEGILRDVLAALTEREIGRSTTHFSEQFTFNDYGLGLEFRDKGQLTEFFRKELELYPDFVRLPDAIFVSGDHVIAEWTLRFTSTEPFYSGLTRRVPMSVHGASVVRIENGKITHWSDYYDGLTSRLTALASHFTEWIEL